MTQDNRRRFWKTLPGIITATAGLISAIAALIGGLIAAGFITVSHPIVTAASTRTPSGHRSSGGGSGGTGGGTASGGGTGGIVSGGGTGGGSGGGSGGGTGGGSGSGGQGGSSSGGQGGGNCTLVAASDTSTLQGTFLFDFDSGAETQNGADVWWDQHTDTVRSLDPQPGTAIANLGVVDFGSLSCAALRSEPYASAPIDGNNDATNQLTDGDVFVIRTDQGNYAKVQVVSYGYDLELKFETYRAG